MDYDAHRLGDDGDRSKWQPLAKHLVAVADPAERFARKALPATTIGRTPRVSSACCAAWHSTASALHGKVRCLR